MRMPPGYRFVPTDYELINHHLLNKITNQPNLIEEIKDVQLYNNDPQTLAESYSKVGDKEWYFFTSRNRKYPKGKRPSRSAGSGYWKATGADKKVFDEAKRLIGFKRTLVYYRGTHNQNLKTDWVMHEFRVDQPPRTRTHSNDMKLDDWVLCRIYKKDSKLRGVDKQQESNSTTTTTGVALERKGEQGSSSTSSAVVAGEREGEQEANAQPSSANYDPINGGGFLDMMMQDWDVFDVSNLWQDTFVQPLNC